MKFLTVLQLLIFFNLTCTSAIFIYIKGILKRKISFIQFHQFIFEQFIKFAVQLIFQMNNCFANNEFSLVFCKVVNFQGYYWRDNKPTYGLKFSVNIQVSLRDEIINLPWHHFMSLFYVEGVLCDIPDLSLGWKTNFTLFLLLYELMSLFLD